MVRRRRLVALAVVAAGLVATLEFAVGPASERVRQGASVEPITIDSRAVGRKLDAQLVIPSGGGSGRPLLVFLHGRGNDERSNLTGAMYRALSSQGDRAPVAVFPDGGGDSYWHDRATGRWESYVLEEVIPAAIKRSGADRSRVAIGGISMGGWGALSIASGNPDRFCAVGGHSAAIWTDASQSAAGAFDDAEDFVRHDLIEHVRTSSDPFGHTAVWLDSGDQDPFVAGIDALAGALRDRGEELTLRHPPGGHEGTYWSNSWPGYMRFYARELARCT